MMSAIANRAKVTTAALHYYFENKESLYKAVLQRPIDEIQETLGQLNFDCLSPEQALKEIMTNKTVFVLVEIGSPSFSRRQTGVLHT